MLEEYTYEEVKSGRVETLVEAIERIEKLEKQLKLAKFWLDRYADMDNWDSQDVYIGGSGDGWCDARKGLEEMENV